MSWIHSSKGVVLGLLVAVSIVAVGTAAAVTVAGSPPAQAQVGESVTAETTVQEPFRDTPDQWTLQAETDLINATWTVRVVSQGDPIDTQDFGDDSFTYDLDRDTGATTVEIEVSGEVPPLESYSYRERDVENYTAISIARLSNGTENELRTFRSHRYTAAEAEGTNSLEARQAIDAAIEAVGDTNDKIEQAISSYDNGNFENAEALAEEAESGAQSSQLLMIGAGAVVLLVLVGGGVYYWRQRQQSTYKLQ